MATSVQRTSTLGSLTTWTWSGWFKRGIVSSGSHMLFSGLTDGNNYTQCYFDSGDDFRFLNSVSSSLTGALTSDRKFRDPGAWYHIVVNWDTTNVTAGDRIRLYVNGVEETSFSTDTQPGSSDPSTMNKSGSVTSMGGHTLASEDFYGELSHCHFIDGTIYGPTTFGEFDSTSGIWKIKTSPSVTYGTNGWFLKFEDRTNLDLDSGTNAFTFTTTGTLTATYDNPSNNFATLNPLAKDVAATYAISNGNTTVQSSSGWWTMPLTLGVGGGKWYFEAKMDNLSNYAHVGWATADQISQGGVDSYFGGVSVNESACGYGQDGPIYYSTTTSNGQDSGTYGNTFTTGDVIGCALDLDNGFAYWSKNGTWQNSGVPTSGATGTGAFPIDNPSSKGYLWLPGVAIYSATWSVNAGNGYFGTTLISSPEADDGGIGAFAYDVPAGYRAVCTKNIKAYGG